MHAPLRFFQASKPPSARATCCPLRPPVSSLPRSSKLAEWMATSHGSRPSDVRICQDAAGGCLHFVSERWAAPTHQPLTLDLPHLLAPFLALRRRRRRARSTSTLCTCPEI